MKRQLTHQVQGQLSTLQAMVKDLCRRSKGGGRDDWPEELFRLFTDLLDAELSEEVARELVERRPQRSARRGPFRSDDAEGPRGRHDRGRHSRGRPDPGHARPLPAGGAGGADRRGQDHDHRQAGRQLPPEGKTPRRPDHGRHLPHRRRRAVADLCRHHRPADARRLDAAGNARDGRADEPSRPDPAGHGRPQPQGRSPHSGTQGVS